MKKCTLILALLALLSGCRAPRGEPTYRVAIVQQTDHVSLDEIRTAIGKLDTLAAENGVTVACSVYSGQNDATVLAQIGAEILSEDFDAVIPIATLAAQCMAAASAECGLPVVYAAVSDPEKAGLTGLANVTGTSDALDTALLLDMMLAVDPDVRTVGLLYANSEPNSARPIREAKAYLKKKGIAYLEKTGNTTDEILCAAAALAGRADAVFTPTDNTVMGAAGAVAEILRGAGVPFYAGADSFAAAGAFAACGAGYTALGERTAEMAFAILLGGEIPPYETVPGGGITVNTETAGALGIDWTVFEALADPVRTVTP